MFQQLDTTRHYCFNEVLLDICTKHGFEFNSCFPGHRSTQPAREFFDLTDMRQAGKRELLKEILNWNARKILNFGEFALRNVVDEKSTRRKIHQLIVTHNVLEGTYKIDLTLGRPTTLLTNSEHELYREQYIARTCVVHEQNLKFKSNARAALVSVLDSCDESPFVLQNTQPIYDNLLEHTHNSVYGTFVYSANYTVHRVKSSIEKADPAHALDIHHHLYFANVKCKFTPSPNTTDWSEIEVMLSNPSNDAAYEFHAKAYKSGFIPMELTAGNILEAAFREVAFKLAQKDPLNATGLNPNGSFCSPSKVYA